MNEDAQREMEQRALRNVRSLVDTIQTREQDNRRAMIRLARWIALGAGLAIALLYGWYRFTDRPDRQGRTVVIPAPERPGAPAKAP